MSQGMDLDVAQKIDQARTFKGRPPEETIGFDGTLGELLNVRAAETPDKEFLSFVDDRRRITRYSYAQFRAEVHRVANYLAEGLDLHPGDRIANVAHNHVDSVILYWAAWSLGLTVVPINVGEEDERVQFIIDNAECKVVFVRPAYLDRIVALRDQVATVRSVVQVAGEALLAGADHHFHYESESYGDVFMPLEAVGPGQEALIVYTSGTTGAPKGVILSQYNLLVDAHGVGAWHRFTSDQKAMCVLPIHHVNGTVVTLVMPMVRGGATVLNQRFSPRRFWSLIEQEGVNVVSVVPTLLAYLLEWEADHGDFSNYDLDHFRHIICGAGPLTVQLARAFEDTFGVRLIHGYGLSETTCYSCFLPLDQDDATHKHWMRDYGYPSIGVPIPPNEMAIHDAEGQPLQPGASHKGEIVIRGHNVMQGYYRRPDANASAFAHGWFRSGDEGFRVEGADGHEYFFITGRIKELIIRGGVNYSPFEIDEALTTIDGVKVGLAVGFPNKYYGEEVGAYVVPDAGSTITPETILAAMAERFPFSKRPKVVVFGEEAPVTSTGKYKRLQLAPLFAEYEETQFREG